MGETEPLPSRAEPRVHILVLALPLGKRIGNRRGADRLSVGGSGVGLHNGPARAALAAEPVAPISVPSAAIPIPTAAIPSTASSAVAIAPASFTRRRRRRVLVVLQPRQGLLDPERGEVDPAHVVDLEHLDVQLVADVDRLFDAAQLARG